jgi:uncharacterized protein
MSSKPRIQPDDLDLAFYNATAEAGRLCLQHCQDCGNWTHPARYYCPKCSSANYAFDPVSGEAQIHSYTISHFSIEPAWKDLVPYAALVAETVEGPRVVARTEMSREEVRIGVPIRLAVEVMDSEFSYVWASAAEVPE